MQAHRENAWLVALILTSLIVYASLYPFEGWRDQGLSPFVFLSAPWPNYWSRFDVIANGVGYAPLGFALVLVVSSHRMTVASVPCAVLACGLLSLALEALQTYLPQRVPQLADWLLNVLGATVGAALACAAVRLGAIEWWEQLRAKWFTPDVRAALLLLALWPAALLFPPAVPLALGQVRVRLLETAHEIVSDTPFAVFVDVPIESLRAVSNANELVCVALGLVIPCLLAYGVSVGWQRRLALFLCIGAAAVLTSGMSAALSFGPEHAWSWLGFNAQVGLATGLVFALLCVPLPRRWCWVFLLVALVWQLGVINAAPATPYYAQTLQTWEQGRFIRFHGLAQWLGWLWPYAALGLALLAVVRRRRPLADKISA